MKLFLNALTKFIVGILLVGTLVFLPAGTLKFTDGWNFIIVLFIPILAMGIVLLIKSPELLKKRLNAKEKENTQKGVVMISAIVFFMAFIASGLDFRFGWSTIPFALKTISAVLFLASYCLYAEVMRENEYLSRTIEVQKNQKVIDTGLYGIVRHPMYGATIIMFLSIPIILGSWISFLIFLIYPILIAIRIHNEEKILTEQLKGYKAYKKKVKYRVIPFIW